MKSKTCYAILNQYGNFVSITHNAPLLFSSRKVAIQETKATCAGPKERVVKVLITVVMENDK